jgi:hypothetical protein
MNQEVAHMLEHAMTAADLIAELRNFDPQAKVVLASDYGDRAHTQQAIPVESVDEIGQSRLKPSAYSQSGVAIGEDVGEPGNEAVAVLNLY